MNENLKSHVPFGFFSGYGMRPFFLFAGVFATVAMLFWVGWLALHAMGGMVRDSTTPFPAMLWHSHEMLFGYTSAVIAGFLLTAVPTWTDSPILNRGRLVTLVSVWLAGRLAVGFGVALPGVLVAAIDIAFPLVLGAMIAGPLWRRRAVRNYLFVGVLATFALANAMTHADVLGWANTAQAGLLLGLDTVVVLMVVVGGRVVPAFTTGTLRSQGIELRKSPWFDRLAIAGVLALVIADLLVPYSMVTGILALGAGGLQLIRMTGWRSWNTRDEALLWVLHLGYFWIAAGLMLKGSADLWDWISPSAALHGLTIGAVGTLTMAVMSRAALGHTGRVLKASHPLAAAYILVSVAALVRVIGPAAMPEWYSAVMIAAGLLWVAAFATFSALYWPVLTRPRIDGRPG